MCCVVLYVDVRGRANLLHLVAYWHFLTLRYRVSLPLRALVDNINRIIDSILWHPLFPAAVRSAYNTLKQWHRRIAGTA